MRWYDDTPRCLKLIKWKTILCPYVLWFIIQGYSFCICFKWVLLFPPCDLLISRRNNWLYCNDFSDLTGLTTTTPQQSVTKTTPRHGAKFQNKDILLSYATSRMSLTVFPITFHDPIGPLFNFGHIFRANKERILHFYEECDNANIHLAHKWKKDFVSLNWTQELRSLRLGWEPGPLHPMLLVTPLLLLLRFFLVADFALFFFK